MIGMGPSQLVIKKHLEQVKSRCSGPAWNRGKFSLELLLGLRDPAVDEELLKLAPARPDDTLQAKAFTSPCPSESRREPSTRKRYAPPKMRFSSRSLQAAIAI